MFDVSFVRLLAGFGVGVSILAVGIGIIFGVVMLVQWKPRIGYGIVLMGILVLYTWIGVGLLEQFTKEEAHVSETAAPISGVAAPPTRISPADTSTVPRFHNSDIIRR